LAEKFAEDLVERSMAELIKDGGKDGDYDGNSQNFCRVYRVYIGEHAEFYTDIRFWYDEEHDRASFRITREGMDSLLDAASVVMLMMNLGKKVSKNGSFNIQELENLANDALSKYSGEKVKVEVKDEH
jgi:hypothetical protein